MVWSECRITDVIQARRSRRTRLNQDTLGQKRVGYWYPFGQKGGIGQTQMASAKIHHQRTPLNRFILITFRGYYHLSYINQTGNLDEAIG